MFEKNVFRSCRSGFSDGYGVPYFVFSPYSPFEKQMRQIQHVGDVLLSDFTILLEWENICLVKHDEAYKYNANERRFFRILLLLLAFISYAMISSLC